MSKRLIMVLAFAFVVGITCAAYAEVQNIKVSGDITVIGAMRELDLDNGNSGASPNNDPDKSQFIAGITRLRVDADLTDMVSATVRLINERLWGEANNATSSEDASDIDLDLAYVTLKEFLYSPLTLTVGLQNLRFGNAMIVGDPLTNNVAPLESIFEGVTPQAYEPDLTMRKAFEAIRATLDYDPLVVDVITAKISEGTKNVQDDHDLYGVNLNYKVDDNTVAEGYYFLKYYGREGFTTGPRKVFRVDTIGGRLQTKLTDNLTYHLETAWQLGRGLLNPTTGMIASSAKRRAFAVETAASMNFPDTKYVPSLTALYAYFSGQKGDVNKKIKAWDPMYEDQKFGDIANAQIPQSNAHILGVIGTMKPTDDVTLMGEYYAYWWDKKYGDDTTTPSVTTARGDQLFMDHDKFAGSELDLKAIYDYTEDVQIALMTGLFFPGGSFDDRNDSIATEVIGSMKVTF
ncbi:MAG: hypothetical protein AMJ95_12095 [Omnitrophica WOR_2 bacterium SM23_72]|nr:MAG: hypothetical protein AMJ95_12095 [Omnitrophica WOR_2 bacterium SM23_72]